MEEEQERELVVQAKSGSKDAFAELYRSIYVEFYKYAYFMLGNREDAEDVVSEAVMDMYLGISGLKKEEAFRAWAFKILMIKCKLRRKQYITGDVLYQEEVGEAQVAETEEPGKYLDLKDAFSKLSGEEQNILFLSVIAGYKSVDIEKMLKMKAATIRSKMSRALAKLERRLSV